jgi:translocation and assembly module TamB
VALTVNGAEDIGGVGEVRIVKGQYRTYGVELKVERGRIVFAGPLERTRLDILAVRKIEGVARSIKLADRFVRSTASGAAKSAVAQPSATTSASTETQTVGVQITGLAQKPRIALYSSPFLSDADTLSYMVLGRPVSGDAAQSSLLFSAAGSLFGRGEAGSIQEGVKKILGLETLEVGTETFTSQQGQVEQTMARVGRYLAPNLYIGIGRSLFTNEYVITARYSLSKSWEIQTRAGAQTGGEIYYKIEFD